MSALHAGAAVSFITSVSFITNRRVAFGLSRLSHLRLLQPIYTRANILAGLVLKTRKCNLTPCLEVDPSVSSKIREWLQMFIPAWVDFGVCDAIELLGFYLGTRSGEHLWVKPLSKYKRRIADIKRASAGIALNVHDYNIRVVPVLGYVSQLAPLPDGFQLEQRVALHTLFRAPMNTFAHADFFQLKCVRMPNIRCAMSTAAASLFRTATKTVKGWHAWLGPMQAAACEHLIASLPLHPIRSSLSPTCWDMPSFAEILCMASKGQVGNKFEQIDVARVANAKKVQHKVYSLLLESKFAPSCTASLTNSIQKRVVDLFLPFTVDFGDKSALPHDSDGRQSDGNLAGRSAPPNHIDLADCLKVLSEIGVANRAKVIKTWLNGWATSHRMHEPQLLGCLLGCEGQPDKLSHYVHCPRVFAAAKFVSPETSDDPLIRLGLKQSSKLSLTISACIFTGYHGLKAKIRCNNNSSDMDYFSNWCLFAQHCNAEAVECGLCSTLFAPDSFLCFLNNPAPLASQ